MDSCIGWRCLVRVNGRFPPVLRDVVNWELVGDRYEPVPRLYAGERYERLDDGKLRIYQRRTS